MSKKMSRVTLFFLGAIILLGLLSCSFFSNLLSRPSPGLAFSRAVDGSISGSFKYPNNEGREQVNFSVSADGVAGFWLEDGPEADLLTVDYHTLNDPHMSWRGQTFDGYGPLSEEGQAVLNELLVNEMTYGLAMIPLDFACQPEAMVDPTQVAALLYPLQMRFKYKIADRGALATMFSFESACQYGDREVDEVSSPSLIMMSPSSPVPVVFGYFPFDAEGALEKTAEIEGGNKLASLKPEWLGANPYGLRMPDLTSFGPDPIRDEWGPCEAKCRGACGSDCHVNSCKVTYDDRCEKNEDGTNNGFRKGYYVYECGIHPACIEHDVCYDACNSYYGCGTFAAIVCMHTMTGVSMPIEALMGTYISCDSQVVITEGPLKAKDWMSGFGPFTAYQVFEYSDRKIQMEYDTAYCPLDEAAPPEEQVVEPEEPKEAVEPVVPPEEVTSLEEPEVISTIPVGVYLGEIQFTEDQLKYAIMMTSDVTIIVAEDGTVTGAFTGQIVDSEYCYDPYCYQWTTDYSGTFSGTLTNAEGVIQSEESMIFSLVTNDPQTYETASGAYSRDVSVKVSGDRLIGVTAVRPDYPNEPIFILNIFTTKFE